MKKNKKIFIPVIILLVAILVYTLGFSSNLAYANKSFILYPKDYAISDFNDKIQKFNNLIFYFTIILFLMLISIFLTNGHSRTKYLKVNVVTISVLSGGMIVFSIINFIKLPGYIKEYSELLVNHSEQFETSARIYSLIPNNNMYYLGLILATISLLYAIFMIISLVKRMKYQNQYIQKRNEVLANAK